MNIHLQYNNNNMTKKNEVKTDKKKAKQTKQTEQDKNRRIIMEMWEQQLEKIDEIVIELWTNRTAVVKMLIALGLRYLWK